MPIRADLRHYYGPSWKALSLRIRSERAGWCCEMPGCTARQGEPHPRTGSRVVLTVMHLDHNPANNADDNLCAACQRCHNLYDAPHRHANATLMRHWRLGQLDMFWQPPAMPPVERPIIFSQSMVRALLEGRKTQTRRLATSPLRRCRPGDQLWLREAFALLPPNAYALPKKMAPDAYEAAYYRIDFDRSGKPAWKPSIHMPRWASRLTLIVTEIRRQNLAELTDDDALSEGITPQEGATPRDCFAALWNDLHGTGAWTENPKVIALTFRVHRCNIDSPDMPLAPAPVCKPNAKPVFRKSLQICRDISNASTNEELYGVMS